jgi:predicted metal-binding membrane protein
MADIAHDLRSDFWQAPPPATLPEEDVPPAFVDLPACANCQTEFMVDSRFCYACGSRRVDDLTTNTALHRAFRGMSTALNTVFDWIRAFASLCAHGVRNTISALPSITPSARLAAVRRQTGLRTAPLIAFGAGIVCCLVTAFLAYSASATHEAGASLLAAHLERIEWLLGGTAAFVAGLLLQCASSGD